MNSEEAKATFLLCSLPASMDNIIDNLQTKEGLTYDDVYQRLVDIADRKDAISDDNAYRSTETNKGKGKRSSSKADSEKECTYCKKHYPRKNASGHNWHECFRLKKDRESKAKPTEEKEKEKEKEEQAKIAVKSDDYIEAVSRRTISPLHPSNKWVFDTAASSHMTNNPDIILNRQPSSGVVKLGDDYRVNCEEKGTVHLDVKTSSGQKSPLKMSDVLYVPSLGECNLMSWRAIKAQGRFFLGSNEEGDIFIHKGSKDGKIVVWAKLVGNEYIVQTMEQTARLSSYIEWHNAFGHPAPSSLKPELYDTTIPTVPTKFFCKSCSLSKSTKRKPKSTYIHAKEKLELIHSDLSGKFSVPSYGSYNYYITLIDDKTRYGEVAFLKKKSDSAKAVRNFIIRVQRQTGKKVRRLRSDRGGEYLATDLKEFFNSEGIVHEYSPSHSHESNGVAERYNRTITTMARTMLIGYNKRFWGEAINLAVYLKNRLAHKRVKDQTPYEAYHGKKPMVHHLQLFG